MVCVLVIKSDSILAEIRKTLHILLPAIDYEYYYNTFFHHEFIFSRSSW